MKICFIRCVNRKIYCEIYDVDILRIYFTNYMNFITLFIY